MLHNTILHIAYILAIANEEEAGTKGKTADACKFNFATIVHNQKKETKISVYRNERQRKQKTGSQSNVFVNFE